MKNLKRLIAIALLSAFVSSCQKNEVVIDDQPVEEPFFAEDGTHYADVEEGRFFQPNFITFDADSLYPEGLEFDFRRNRFLVGSLTRGTIGTVSFDGEYEIFIQDDLLTASVGLHIDNIRDNLYAVVSNFFTGQSALACYDLKTKERLFFTDLAALTPGVFNFANDVITDYKGNAYVTDSQASLIYKVTKDGDASIFLDDDALIPTQGFGLNGITYHPFGFLLVATGDDVFFRIPVKNPESFTTVDLGIGGFVDGIQITNLKTVYAVAASSIVYKLRSEDNWQTVEVIDSFETSDEFPTTLANSYFSVYVIHAYLNDLFGGTTPAISRFSIEKVPF